MLFFGKDLKFTYMYNFYEFEKHGEGLKITTAISVQPVKKERCVFYIDINANG